MLTESDTRARFIDPALAASGWGSDAAAIQREVRVRREYVLSAGRLVGSGQRSRGQIADYLLEYKGQNLAVVEAKKFDAAHTEGVGQAKEYAAKAGARFAFSTNGQQIYMIDMKTGEEEDVDTFPSPETLWNLAFSVASEWRDAFGGIPIESKSGAWSTRYYQDIAVNRVLDAIIAGQDRILLTLATGTGKTSIAFQIAWKLFQTRWTLQGDAKRRPRILFLADRNILANQAFNEFSVFPEDALVRIDPGSIRKKGGVPMNGSVFFTIFQTFMTGNTSEPTFGEYPPDFFDFIIVDECHRGGAKDESTWRGILEYFSPAVQLGLTATPKRTDNVDTYKYFGDPVYSYSLKDGINDGYLTPFRVKKFDTTLDEYVYVPDDEILEGEVEPGKIYREGDFNTIIEIREREEKRVQIMLDSIKQNEKTLVFCANQNHALLIRDLINQNATHKDANYCHRVTADEGEIGNQHLRAFQDNEKTIPTILTTSHKLSTGVDARNIRNIVLLRPIKSMIEFKQIIGRGTRLFDGKDYFTVLDFVKAYEHFADPEWDGDPIEPDPPVDPRTHPCGVCDCTDFATSSNDTCATCGHSRSEHGMATPPPPVDPPKPSSKKVKIKLADGKERTIQHMTSTMFYGPDGVPLSVEEFIKSLFETLTLPDFFASEDALREIWADPTTRKNLLARLEDAGFGVDSLRAIQEMISAEDSDLFDVLQYVAFAIQIVSRRQRAEGSRQAMSEELTSEQRDFVNFVIAQYIERGSEELDDAKLPTLVELKFESTAREGANRLGGLVKAREIFVDFQRHLYKPNAEYALVG